MQFTFKLQEYRTKDFTTDCSDKLLKLNKNKLIRLKNKHYMKYLHISTFIRNCKSMNILNNEQIELLTKRYTRHYNIFWNIRGIIIYKYER